MKVFISVDIEADEHDPKDLARWLLALTRGPQRGQEARDPGAALPEIKKTENRPAAVAVKRSVDDLGRCRKCLNWYASKFHQEVCRRGPYTAAGAHAPVLDGPVGPQGAVIKLPGDEGHTHEFKILPFAGSTPVLAGDCWCGAKKLFRTA